MSEIAVNTVHEAYAFACMRCGHGWEQAYEIEHHVDGAGNTFVVYKADGEKVPSPLSTPTCTNCGGHVVRIMRSGRVSLVQQLLQGTPRKPSAMAGSTTTGISPGQDDDERVAAVAVPAGAGAARHWHLSDLFHPFQRH
ncbi:hypothetical protein [Streptomyces sp. NBC_00102]|uniref:hypothetical protein n=1 Tax=Streptomyces sp. NBC_00102 TaxID=2975652 RepID=UPI002254B81F|nr:hypothetical protein [Streptomyces sp. NBC_00102]MCX5399057.1 hypothetical protein [Streptomyces sp. NBC_00102]